MEWHYILKTHIQTEEHTCVTLTDNEGRCHWFENDFWGIPEELEEEEQAVKIK